MHYSSAGLTHVDQNKATPGYTLFSPSYQLKTFLIDLAGEFRHGWDLTLPPGNYAYLLPNGNLLAAQRTEVGPKLPAKGGLIQEIDWDGNIIWEHQDDFQHHDFRHCENGNVIYLAWEKMPDEYVARIGGDFRAPSKGDTVWGDVIKEVDRKGNVVWQWVGWEHMDIEKYPLSPLATPHEYAHPNTLVPLGDHSIMLCFRSLDLVAVLDRASGRFTYTRKEADWGGPHDFQLLENGNYLVFANRDGMNPRGSAVIEWDPKTDETVWKYMGNPSHTFDSHRISGAQRLSSGNTLICQGIWGRFIEVTPDGEIVWEYVNPHTIEQKRGPTIGNTNSVFRCYRYDADGPEIRGRLGPA